MDGGEQKPPSKADLARHWGCSRPYITKLSKPEAEGGKNMPEFQTLAEADAWRAVNAPPKATRVESVFAGEQSSAENQTVSPKNAPASAGTTTGATTEPPRAHRTPAGGKGKAPDALAHVMPEHIDVASMINRDVDFDELSVQHAEEVPQIAHGLYLLAAKTGHPSAISAAIRNWHEACSASANIRERFLEIQEKSRALIPIDLVMDVLAPELQAVRVALTKLGERIAPEANPADPGLAQRVIDAAVDRVFEQLSAIGPRAQRDLSAPPSSAASAGATA